MWEIDMHGARRLDAEVWAAYWPKIKSHYDIQVPLKSRSLTEVNLNVDGMGSIR